MIPRRGAAVCVALFASLATAVLASQSSAARALAPIDPGTPFHRAASPSESSGSCVLGIQGEATNVGNLFPPDDTYFMRLDPSACGACSVVVLSRARIQLEFRKACTVPVELRLVKAFGTPCFRPDEFQVVAGPLAADLAGLEEGVTEFAVDLPSSWRIEENTFLAVDFVAVVDSCSTVEDQPRLAFRALCVPCTAYDDFGDDVCSLGAPAIPLIAVDVAECILTPALRRSWGSTKLRYR